MLNYFGQLRVYSLLDLCILLIATQATTYEFLGVILLHVAFLAYLETRHNHSYRKKVPEYLWIILSLIGLVLYGHTEGILFILCSYIYTLKTKKAFAGTSPILRGLQCFFLVGGIIGYENRLTWIVLIIFTIRNLCGDLRDVEKDKKEGLKTLPVILGLNKGVTYIHLVATFVTTFVWFQFTNLSLLFLIPILLVQLMTYRLTPR
ncbi:MAG: hypothetical protein V4664_02595 [Patescibacteria group bacterium]